MAAKKKTARKWRRPGRHIVDACMSDLEVLEKTTDPAVLEALEKRSGVRAAIAARELIARISAGKRLTVATDGAFAVAHDARRGEAYARAELLAAYFSDMAEALPVRGQEPHLAEDAETVHRFWRIFARDVLGSPEDPSPKEQRMQLMRALDEIKDVDVADVLGLADAEEADRADVERYLRLHKAWGSDRAGAGPSGSGKRRSKFELIAEGTKNEPFAAAPKTWENDYAEMKGGARRRKR